MEEPFDCLCGSNNCLKKIGGAVYLNLEDLKKYKVSSFVMKKYNTQEGKIVGKDPSKIDLSLIPELPEINKEEKK